MRIKSPLTDAVWCAFMPEKAQVIGCVTCDGRPASSRPGGRVIGATALLLFALFSAVNVEAQPVALEASTLPIELPANDSFGLNYRPLDSATLSFQIRYSDNDNGAFGLSGNFFGVSETTQFLSCLDPSPDPGEPAIAILEIPAGSTIDGSLDDGGICSYSNDSSSGRFSADSFTGSNGFVALRTRTAGDTFYGYLQIQIADDQTLTLLGGAIQSTPDASIITRNQSDTVFADRYESSSTRGIPPFGLPVTLPHSPRFSISVWLRNEVNEDFIFSAGPGLGNYLIDPGESPGFKRVLVDTGGSDTAVPVPAGTLVSNALVDGVPDRAWDPTAQLLGADFSSPDRFLPVRFTIVSESFRFGYLGLQVSGDGALLVKAGDWEMTENQPILIP